MQVVVEDDDVLRDLPQDRVVQLLEQPIREGPLLVLVEDREPGVDDDSAHFQPDLILNTPVQGALVEPIDESHGLPLLVRPKELEPLLDVEPYRVLLARNVVVPLEIALELLQHDLRIHSSSLVLLRGGGR